jgi:hypothetical protein
MGKSLISTLTDVGGMLLNSICPAVVEAPAGLTESINARAAEAATAMNGCCSVLTMRAADTDGLLLGLYPVATTAYASRQLKIRIMVESIIVRSTRSTGLSKYPIHH